jgi:hypothetical protein
LVDPPAPAEEEADYDLPIERSEDEDIEEGERDRYLDRVFEGEIGGVRRPKARLAIVALRENGEQRLGIAIQGIGPISGDWREQLAEKARLLKAIGRALIAEYREQLAKILAGEEVHLEGRLVQTALAKQLQEGSISVSTWRTRISKTVNREWVELADGRLVPLGVFFRSRRGPIAKKEVRELLRFLAEHPTWTAQQLASGYLRRRGLRPGQPKLADRYRKRFERLRNQIVQEIERAPGTAIPQLAERYVARLGLATDRDSIEAAAQAFHALRGKQRWLREGRKRAAQSHRSG